jgi:hypothetical protein
MGHLTRKLILTRKDQNDQLEKSSDRLLRDKQFRDKEGILSKFKWSHSCQTTQKKLIKTERVKEVVFMHVWLCGIKGLLGKTHFFGQGLQLS